MERTRGVPAGREAADLDRLLRGSGWPAPIFVLAPPGAPGETAAAALGRNPACFGLPEINLELSGNLDALLRMLTGVRSSQMHGLLRGLSHLLAGEQSMAGIDMARRWLMRHLHLTTQAVWRQLALRVAPRRMVVPLTTTLFEEGSLGRLVAAFPEAQYVALRMHPGSYGQAVMQRHGGAAAWMLGAVDESVAPVIADPGRLWLMAEEGVQTLRQLRGRDGILSLRAEDLAHDAPRALAGLARDLGLPDGPEAVAAMCAPEASPFRGPGPVGATGGGDILSLADLAERIPPLDGQSLTGRAVWRDDGMPMAADLRQAAEALGYR